MAAAYGVPLGGALFALEVLRGILALRLVLPALLTSLIATIVSWTVLPDAPTYFIPSFQSIGVRHLLGDPGRTRRWARLGRLCAADRLRGPPQARRLDAILRSRRGAQACSGLSRFRFRNCSAMAKTWRSSRSSAKSRRRRC